MTMRSAFLAALLIILCGPGWAINKCIAPDGGTVFQDAPCQSGKGGKIDVKPASGGASISVPVTAAEGNSGSVKSPQTEAQRIEAKIAASQRDRRIQELELRHIPDARQRIDNKHASCQQEMDVLRSKKRQASNNLAGATWEQSLSSEMNAIATRCDTESRSLADDLARYRKELADLISRKTSQGD